MNLSFNTKLADGYSSNSQIARVLTENWVKENSYCPCCGEVPLNEFENNRPVADFYCKKCSEEFELKSKNGKFSNTINLPNPLNTWTDFCKLSLVNLQNYEQTSKELVSPGKARDCRILQTT
jgi:hypothetical protein